jgi:hypothetical protein
MATPGITSDDMDGDTRDYLNANLKEGLSPDGVFSDWGDCENDHTASGHATADGRGDDPLDNAVNFFSSQETGTISITGEETNED